jgi:hypothetical protein
MLPFQKIGDLLATALVLADAQGPDQAFEHRRNRPGSSGPLLGLRMVGEKPGEPVGRNPVELEPNGLPMSPSMRRKLSMPETLGGVLPGQRDVGGCLHGHRLLWTVGYLRQYCGCKRGRVV